jgi:hypothetical protein
MGFLGKAEQIRKIRATRLFSLLKLPIAIHKKGSDVRQYPCSFNKGKALFRPCTFWTRVRKKPMTCWNVSILVCISVRVQQRVQGTRLLRARTPLDNYILWWYAHMLGKERKATSTMSPNCVSFKRSWVRENVEGKKYIHTRYIYIVLIYVWLYGWIRLANLYVQGTRYSTRCYMVACARILLVVVLEFADNPIM